MESYKSGKLFADPEPGDDGTVTFANEPTVTTQHIKKERKVRLELAKKRATLKRRAKNARVSRELIEERIKYLRWGDQALPNKPWKFGSIRSEDGKKDVPIQYKVFKRGGPILKSP